MLDLAPSNAAAAKAWPHGHPRVLQVVPSLKRGGGGAERSAIDVAASLAASGLDSYIASEGGDMMRELGRAGVAHITLPLASKNPITIALNIGRLARAIEQLKIDIVHARSRAPAISALKASRRTGARFVTTVHGAHALSGFLKRRYNAVMTKGELVIANSHFMAAHLTENYDLPNERIRVVPRGIDLTRFDPARVSPERVIRLSRAWRLPDGQPVVMLPARLTRLKGHAHLIEAIARLSRNDVVCALVGDATDRQHYRAQLLAQAEKCALGARLLLVDHCDDMPAAYMLADVVVSASIQPESFGRTIAEAQAMGRPVVASNHGGAPEQILEGETGWTYPPQDSDALAQAIGKALALGQEGRARLALAAREHVRRNYSVEVMCARTRAVYDELAPASDQ